MLVLLHHAAITYGAIGGWFYREVPTDGRLETKLLIFFCTVNQAFFMGLFFLLAGYFTPASLARHGPWAYAKERAIRLGVPLLVFGFLIGPGTAALAQTARGRPFATTLMSLLERGTFENGPLWFVEALLIFAAGYLAWRQAFAAFARGSAATSRPFPSNAALFLAAVTVGAAAFLLRLFWPVGTQAFGLQLGYFASYVLLFVAGCMGGVSGAWLGTVPKPQQQLWLRVTWITLPVLPAIVLLAPRLPILSGDTAGGWNIQAVVYAFWEPFVAWGIILTLLRIFARRFSNPGPIWIALGRRAYAIFIIHPPILVAVALLWRHVEAPHLVKFLATGSATCVACYWIAGALLRIPLLRRIV